MTMIPGTESITIVVNQLHLDVLSLSHTRGGWDGRVVCVCVCGGMLCSISCFVGLCLTVVWSGELEISWALVIVAYIMLLTTVIPLLIP